MPTIDKGQRAHLPLVGGMDERALPGATGAALVVNMTVDRTTGDWSNGLGWERFWPGSGNFAPFTNGGPVTSLFVWSKHQGAQQHILYETDGTLNLLDDWSGIASPRAVPLLSGRPVPRPSEPGTMFAPMGDWLVMTNGHNEVVRFGGWPVTSTTPAVRLYGVGWSYEPPPPRPWGVDTTPDSMAPDEHVAGVWWQGAADGGLGSDTGGEENRYTWKVAFLSDAGGISPLSNDSPEIVWDTPSAGAYSGSRFTVPMEVPTGPPGTVARLVYRTRNGGSTYFYEGQLPNNEDKLWWSWRSDAALSVEAPSPDESILMPMPRAKHAAGFKNCLFLLDGTDLVWSRPGAIDQFGALDYYSLGSREGGDGTGLYAYYNMLLVLRERSIDMVRGAYGDFAVEPLVQLAGVLSPNAVDNVPEVGVLMLTTDGVKVLQGSVQGGGQVQLKDLSAPISKTLRRINEDALARATSAYSPRWREWHCYVPADGADKPSLGLVLSVDKLLLGQSPWSIREGFPVGALSTTYLGDFLFGHNTGGIGAPTGLFVISSRRTAGQSVVMDAIVDNAPHTSELRSRWHDFADPARKAEVKHVALVVRATTRAGIQVQYRKDTDLDWQTTQLRQLMPAEGRALATFGTAVLDGTAKVEDENHVRVQFDVHQKGAERFQFRVVTTEPAAVRGYELEYIVNGARTSSGRKA